MGLTGYALCDACYDDRCKNHLKTFGSPENWVVYSRGAFINTELRTEPGFDDFQGITPKKVFTLYLGNCEADGTPA